MKPIFSALVFCASTLLAITPAELAIEQASASITANPNRPEGYSALAFAYSRRARELSNVAYYDKALAAVEKSLALEAGNYDALKAKTWALLGKHDFSGGLILAQNLNKKMPDDLQVYGFLTDANLELGHYAEAEKAAQLMLDLRPGNVAGLTRGAYLREIFGDLDGAIDLMQQALRRLRPQEVEDQAWILTQIGHLHLMRGEASKAERVLGSALKIFPDYPYTLATLGKAKVAQGQYEAAVELLRKSDKGASRPENLYEVGVALHKGGKLDEAKTAFAEFEEAARKESNNPYNSNRELIFYYLDYADKAKEALRIAEREAARRQDVFTLDAYAWALYKNGKTAEAKTQLKKALDVGVREPEMLARAAILGMALTQ
ncbi:MAG: tetratricopeptide repeat protein [Bryobacteraceae bacterium]